LGALSTAGRRCSRSRPELSGCHLSLPKECYGDTEGDLGEFRSWLATEKPEQIVDLDDDANFTHLDNLIEVGGNQVRMTRPSHRLVVVSAKGRRGR
jgi:hypothetical protein